MLRRFESYGFAADAGPEPRAELARVLRDTGLHIPEVLDSAVGRNRSATAVDLVWEHAYARPDEYSRYMCHPFHICVLDRFLLPENPECITAPRRGLQLGLFGYEVDGAPFRAAGGIRRVVAMRTRPDAAGAAVDAFLERLNRRGATTPGVAVSVAAANTMGLEWFPDGWTHVWEQAFADEDAMGTSLEEEAALLAGSPMGEWVDLWYEIERGAPAPPARALPEGRSDAWTRVLMIDTVTVPAERADAYAEAFERLYLPGARRRGLDLVAWWCTPADIGEDVVVTTAFDVGTWSDWERARNAAVADPAVAEWIELRRAVMRHGRRQFVAPRSG